MKKNQVSSEEQISKLTLEEKKNSKKSNGVFSFLFRLLLSFIICLLGLIALKGGFGLQIHEWTKKGLVHIYGQQIHFIKVRNMLEEYFGSANLAFFFPSEQTDKDKEKITEAVSTRTVINFDETNTGVLIETELDAAVGSAVDGIVIFAGKNAKSGQTVVIQAKDGTEYWYGELYALQCKIYDKVTKDQIVGIAGEKEGKEVGQYYFAVKKEGVFIDPQQVLQLEP